MGRVSMANDIKSGLGYIIPSAGVVGFFVSLLMGEPIMSIVTFRDLAYVVDQDSNIVAIKL